MAQHYSAIVIGSGQGGGPLATAFANAGRRTALIEYDAAGGTCVNRGCTPTKTLIASGRMAYLAGQAKCYGIEYKRSSTWLNMDRIQQRRKDIVDSFRTSSENRFKNTSNLDLIMGKARFKDSSTIEVTFNTDKHIELFTADTIVINAGCFPSPSTIKDSHVVSQMHTSTSILELTEQPRHLLIIGGGPIGVEFAQLFQRFGTQVSLVSHSAHLLPREDPDISTAVEELLTTEGVKLYLSAKPEWFSRVPTGSSILSITTPENETRSIFASHVLNATGRTPSTAALNLEAAGIKTDAKGYIVVNEHLETSAPDIYAIGDIKGGPAFTHVSYDDFRVLRHNLISHVNAKPLSILAREGLVPACTFIDPQLGRVGYSETEARRAFPEREIKVAKMPMAWVARAIEVGETRGFMKGVVDVTDDDRGRGRILGFACLGIEGGELMSVVQMAMRGGLTYVDLQDMVFAHPLVAESLNNLWANWV